MSKELLEKMAKNLAKGVTRGTAKDLLRVSVSSGKYTLIQRGDGSTHVLRYSENWRDVTGDGLILSMGYRIKELECVLKELKLCMPYGMSLAKAMKLIDKVNLNGDVKNA